MFGSTTPYCLNRNEIHDIDESGNSISPAKIPTTSEPRSPIESAGKRPRPWVYNRQYVVHRCITGNDSSGGFVASPLQLVELKYRERNDAQQNEVSCEFSQATFVFNAFKTWQWYFFSRTVLLLMLKTFCLPISSTIRHLSSQSAQWQLPKYQPASSGRTDQKSQPWAMAAWVSRHSTESLDQMKNVWHC